MVFVVQRDDATCLSPNRDADPEFTSALEEAQRKGVGVYAYGCRVTTEEISLGAKGAGGVSMNEATVGDTGTTVRQVYDLLYERYGPQGWWPRQKQNLMLCWVRYWCSRRPGVMRRKRWMR